MGLLQEVDQLNERDLSVGHRRVYTRERIREHLNAAGVTVVCEDFILLKILSNAQMETLDPKLVEALFEVGHQFPDLCADLYIQGTPT